MKKVFQSRAAPRLSFLVFGLIFGCISCSNQIADDEKNEAIRRAVQEELKLHPKATLPDIYKNFFQGRFGPGHMISDLDGVTKYLEHELQNATEFDSVLWQSVGYKERYYRVNLSLVRDGKIARQDLIAAFVESANTANPPTLEFWKKEWNAILKIIEGMNLTLPNFEKDKAQISENLKNGMTVGHHSAAFRKYHHPHYRIVSKSCFEKLYSLKLKTIDP